MKRQISQQELESKLGSLGQSLPRRPGFADQVLRRVTAESFSAPPRGNHFRLWRSVMKSAMGLAACVVVGFALWQFSGGNPRTAYGLEGVPDRLMAAGTLHLKGTVYSDDSADGHPIELFIKRPGYVRLNGVPSTTRNGQAVTVEYNDVIVTPQQRFEINPEQKRVAISAETAIDAQLQTEQLLQQQLLMLFGQGGDFKKIRTQTLNAHATDVYESRLALGGMASRLEIFLDTTTGIPVQCASYLSIEGGPEKTQLLFDTIQTDQTIPDATFAFAVPAGWEVTHPINVPGMSSRVNDTAFGVRFAISLDKKTTLVCWRAYDVNAPQDDLTLLDNGDRKVEIRGNDGAPFHQHQFRADKTADGFHWRWSVIWTDKPASTWANAMMMSLSVAGPNGNSSSANSFLPAEFSEKDLPKILEEAQRLTLPPGENAKPLTLPEILAQAKQ